MLEKIRCEGGGYICYGIAEAIIICKSQTMYLRLRQSILVSDNVPQSQPIYFSFNQCNIADSVTNNHSLISVETLSKNNNRNIKRKRLDEEIKG